MKKISNNDGYLLLECMVAMFIIVTSILFLMSTMIFLLEEVRDKQKELEVATQAYEMAAFKQNGLVDETLIRKKAIDNNILIKEWNKKSIRIESEEVLLEIKRK
ncbi:hypothetical protein [Vagococcus hydrophili]|uniref:Type II secretion system protein n=1 Tax=Vagococcus hydrophili TaxID=2714947 RepID=A0A6G8ARL4_9ENTE|nr:hypothetical protein [Vagococcus hydrophili]QIL47704.1 hypothetical protein G7082_03705 [Vagococcus hydrophili]